MCLLCKRVLVFGLFVMLTLSSLVAMVEPAYPASAITPEPVKLRMATGTAGGTFPLIGGLLSELARRQSSDNEITVLPGSGTGNPVTVETGKAEMGIAFGSYVSMAYEGRALYDKQGPCRNLRSIACLNIPQHLHIFARSTLPVDSIEDIVKKKYPLKFSTAQRGSSQELYFKWILAEYGVTYEMIEKWGGKIQYVSLTDAVGLFRDGHIDVVIQATSLRSSTPMELEVTGKVKLIPVEQWVIKAVTEKQGMKSDVIPKQTYAGQTQDVRTLSDSPVLFTSAKVSEGMIYSLTKMISENTDFLIKGFVSLNTFDPSKHGPLGYGVPLHDGSAKYYKERGWVR